MTDEITQDRKTTLPAGRYETIDGADIAYPWRATRDSVRIIKTSIKPQDGVSVDTEIFTNDQPSAGRFNVPFLTSLTAEQRHFLVTEINRLRARRVTTRQPDEDDIQPHTIERRGMAIERDARGKPLSIRVQSNFIIDRLLEFGTIDREQHWHAEQFVAMHRVFLRPVATLKTVSAYQSADEASPPAKYPIEDNDYLKVLRDMRHKRQQDIVRMAVDDDEGADAIFAIAPPLISSAFWAMTYAINRLLEAKQKAKEAEEERKKVLARADNPCDSRFD